MRGFRVLGYGGLGPCTWGVRLPGQGYQSRAGGAFWGGAPPAGAKPPATSTWSCLCETVSLL